MSEQQYEEIRKKRQKFGQYLKSISGIEKEDELLKKSGIQRDFLRRILGDNDGSYNWVSDKNAYALCKFVASYEKRTPKEELEILIDEGILPSKIKPNRKIFEEDNQKEESKENAPDIEKLEEGDRQEESEMNDAGMEELKEGDQQEESEKGDADIEDIEGLTTCVKSIIENMHFKIKEKEWKFNSALIYQTIEVEKDSIILAGITTWGSIRLAYLCTDTSDKDYEQIYEILRTHGKDWKILFLILCKDCRVYEKVYESIKMIESKNSILLVNLEKIDEIYILSMHKRHREAFEYEKDFASYIEEGERKGCIFWS